MLRSLPLALLLLSACRMAPDRPGETAAADDLVFRNGAVYTVDAARSWASAVGVRHGCIVYVGTDSRTVFQRPDSLGK
jgi:hypothetical protein